MAILPKIFLSFLFAIAIGCKQGSVSSVSDAGTSNQNAEGEGACVVYQKDTKEIQGICFSESTQKICDESFNRVYENANSSPGKYDKELVLNSDCTKAKLIVAAKFAKVPLATPTSFVQKGKCFCGGFVQKVSDKRYCLVARRGQNEKWQAVAQLPLQADCRGLCEATNGNAAAAFDSLDCRS